MKKPLSLYLVFGLVSGAFNGLAQNPLIMDQFTADPTARVFEGRIYVYPSHDVNCGTNWFCMKDYHVFSSQNLTDWTDHGMIVAQEDVVWVDSTKNSMWAPDCFEKDGKYYFYFPAIAESNTGIRGMAVGAAVSDAPYGPFIPQPEPIRGVSGIDPNVFMDEEGQAYLYWAGFGNLFGARLKANMLELAMEPQPIDSLPRGMKEGPFVFERNGVVYFTFPHVIEETEALVYGMGDNPLGPFEYQGIIMDEHPSGCWTNHHSIVEYNGQWILFYHHNDLSPDFDKNRSIRADSLFFNADGSIQKVVPTLRGVGATDACRKIQIDRYSAVSETGTSVAFLDDEDPFKGWKILLNQKGAWVRYNSVDFKDGAWRTVRVRAASDHGGPVEIRIGGPDGPVIARAEIPETGEWLVTESTLSESPKALHNLTLVSPESASIQIDWVRFYPGR